MRPSNLHSLHLPSMQILILVIAFLTLCSAYRQDISKHRIIEPEALIRRNDPATPDAFPFDHLEIVPNSGATLAGLKRRTGSSTDDQTENNVQGSSAMGGIIGGVIGGILGLINIGAAYFIIRKHYRKSRARAEAEFAYNIRRVDSISKEEYASVSYHDHSEYSYSTDSNPKKKEGIHVEAFLRSNSGSDTDSYGRIPLLTPPSSAFIYSKDRSILTEKERFEVGSRATNYTYRDQNWSRPTTISLPSAVVPVGPVESWLKLGHKGHKGQERSFIIWD